MNKISEIDFLVVSYLEEIDIYYLSDAFGDMRKYCSEPKLFPVKGQCFKCVITLCARLSITCPEKRTSKPISYSF